MVRDHFRWPEASPCRAVSLFLAIFAIAVLGRGATGGEPKAEPKTEREESQPEDVFVGVYVNQIYDLSVKENRFVADFWIWFRWKDDRLRPLETFKVVGSREMET